jgi:hypothetical protein
VIGKAEWTQSAANPRFIVTSLTQTDGDGRHLYENIYCARGERAHGRAAQDREGEAPPHQDWVRDGRQTEHVDVSA